LGAPFFSGVGGALAEGVAVASGVSVGLGHGVSSGDAVGDGDAFLRFDFLFGVGLGDGVGEAFFCFGDAVGDGVGVGFFPEPFRCLRVGAGVGVGAKIFLIFVPNDSSAAFAASIAPNKIAMIKSHFTNSRPALSLLSHSSRL
jgi:hypothetical protein